MSQGSGGEITVRALGPLPDLESVIFFHSKYRDFITGRGPFPVRARPWARRAIRIGTWVLLAAGILVSIGVGVAELYEREQWARLQSVLKTVDAEVVGCGAGDTVPFFRFTADGKVVNHYPPQTRADICDNKKWQVTYIPGDPDAWAVVPDSPLPPFEDNIDEIWIAVGPLILLVAGLYWLFARMQDRWRVRERRLVAEGALVGGELLKVKYYEGGQDSEPSLSVKFRVNFPDGRSIDDKQSLMRFDFTRKTLPPAGSKLLVLWVDEKVRQVL